MRLPLALAGIGVIAVAVAGCSDGDGGDPERGPWVRPPSATPASEPSTTPRPSSAADLARAWDRYNEGEYEQAADDFAAVAAGSPGGSEQRSEALLGAAVAGHESGEADRAAGALREAGREAPPGSTVARQAAYLLAVRLNEAGDAEGARKALEQPVSVPSDDPLQPFLLAEYAEALAGSGRSTEAEAVWDELLASPDLPSSLGAGVYRARADAAHEAGDMAGQVRWLDAYIAETGEPGAYLERAVARRATGDIEGWSDDLQLVVARFPASAGALTALELLLAGGVPVDPGQAGLVYYRRQMYTDAIETLEGATGDGAPPGPLAFRLYYLAAAYEGLGDYAAAIALYDRAAATGAASPYVHRARWWAARLTEETGDGPGASARYVELVRDGPPGEFSAEAGFRAGYALFRAGDASGALAAWDSTGVEDSRTLYWRARATRASGDPAGAEAALRASAAAGPHSFHGLAAAEALGQEPLGDVAYEPLGELPGIDWAAIEAWLAGFVQGAPVEPPADTRAAAGLVKVGLREAAAGLLLDSEGGSDPWSLLARAKQAHALGLADVALALAARLRAVAEPGPEPPAALVRLEYPVHYVALLERSAQQNGVDPLFLAAIIRQESLWDPGAGSPAGALGLMQVVPATGEELAASFGFEDFETADLFRPSVAIPFGARYIAAQMKAFGEPYAALAAYNGGPGNAARWLESAGGGRAVDFVETVDYAETQLYIELVYEHYARYRAAWR